MLAGDNSILQKATDAKTNSEKQGIIEQARIDILGQQTENKGANITKEQLATILDKYFIAIATESIPDEVSSTNDIELTTLDERYKINLSEIFKGKFANNNVIESFGEKYEDSMIGKTINYTSGTNNVTDWIILGKQVNSQGKNDIIITTRNSVSSLELEPTLAEYGRYELKIKNACKAYVGENGLLGENAITPTDVRSITMDDINTAVGFNEIIYPAPVGNANDGFGGVPLPNSDGTGWINIGSEGYSSAVPSESYMYYYDGGYKFGSASRNTYNWGSQVDLTLEKPDNMKYIVAGTSNYWVPTRGARMTEDGAIFGGTFVAGGQVLGGQFSMAMSFGSGTNAHGIDFGNGNFIMGLRPAVIIPSETPYAYVNLGDYATYN